jgi:hypothetical protein
MELEFPCKMFQQHFSKIGRGILEMVQIYEEDEHVYMQPKTFKQNHTKTFKVYEEHLMKLDNSLQIK